MVIYWFQGRKFKTLVDARAYARKHMDVGESINIDADTPNRGLVFAGEMTLWENGSYTWNDQYTVRKDGNLGQKLDPRSDWYKRFRIPKRNW